MYYVIKNFSPYWLLRVRFFLSVFCFPFIQAKNWIQVRWHKAENRKILIFLSRFCPEMSEVFELCCRQKNGHPNYVLFLIPGTCWVRYLTWQKEWCKCDYIKDLEMARWAQCKHKDPYKWKREIEDWVRKKDVRTEAKFKRKWLLAERHEPKRQPLEPEKSRERIFP